MVLGKLDSHGQKNATRPFSYTRHTKIHSKWMKDLNVRQDSIKILEENTGNTLFELGHSNFLQDTSMNARKTQAKMNLGLLQDKKLLHSERNSQQNKKTTYRMGEDTCK